MAKGIIDMAGPIEPPEHESNQQIVLRHITEAQRKYADRTPAVMAGHVTIAQRRAMAEIKARDAKQDVAAALADFDATVISDESEPAL
jgi:hypothetical protein